MFNIAPFLPKQIRALHAQDEPFSTPYSQTQFGVVLMVDVVGFSALTTLAQQKGDSGAEAIAMEIGAYLGECIQVIEFYGGDVVKFLGDAVLVCFQPIHESSSKRRDSDGTATSSLDSTLLPDRQKNMLVRKGVECGLQLLARLSHYRVYLTAEERSKHRTPSGEKREAPKQTIFDALNPTIDDSASASQEAGDLLSPLSPSTSVENDLAQIHETTFDENHFLSIENWMPAFMKRDHQKKKKNYSQSNKKDNRRTSYSSESSSVNNSTFMSNTIDLELHMALSCGNVTNIVLGNVDPKDLSPSAAAAVQKQQQRADDRKNGLLDPKKTMEFSLGYDGRLEYAIGGDVVDSLDEALSIAKAGEMCITPAAYDIVQSQSMNLTFEMRRGFYVIKNILDEQPPRKSSSNYTASSSGTSTYTYPPSTLWNTGTSAPPMVATHRKGSSIPRLNSDFLKTLPGLGTPQQLALAKVSIEPLIPRIRNTSYTTLSLDQNRYYFKYINRSTLYRMKHSMDGNLPAQFREVTIMFVSLGKTDVTTQEGLMMTQKATLLAIEALLKYEGMLQQFAIDDKGATLLSVFGLPPLSHEREAVFAAKAALEIRNSYHEAGFHGFSISLSTGTIFTAIVPQESPYRRDPGIAGDAIIVAVRMLKFPFSKEKVVCDACTRKQIGGLCEFEDFGENFVKGKIKPVQIYGIQHFGPPERDKRISLLSTEKSNDFIGYKSKMESATKFVDNWTEAPNNHVLIVSGPSGVGKSFFCSNLHKVITSHGVLSCWSASTEVEKGNKYYLLRNLVLALFEIVDSDRIPVKTSNTAHCDFHSHNGNSATAETGSQIKPDISPSISESHLSHPPSRVSSTNSFQTSKEWFGRLSSYTTMSNSSFGSGSSGYQEIRNEIIDLVSRCLHKCGEEKGYVPLFKALYATLSDVPENRYTRLLDGRARDILLTGVITRVVLHVSRHVELVLICDNIQWADSTSIRVLQNIHENCQRVMLLMATRPIKDYNVTFTENYKAYGSYEEIELNGLGQAEIGEIILQNFDSGVKRISPQIVEVVQKRTGGNPLYVKNMAIILKDFNHVTVVEGELVPSSNRFDLEDLLGNFDYRRIIKMQFDRLDINYQQFLTVASCLDQYFTIFEIQSVIAGKNIIFENKDPEAIRRHITAFDAYHFIEKVDNVNSLESNITSYAFSHITIPQSIYDMVSYETRISLHRALARHYESQLNHENSLQLIGKITRHYLETDSIVKQLHYLEVFADQNMRSYSLPEATNNLRKIVQILDENNDLLVQFGNVHLSDIYRRLGVCYALRTKLVEGEQYLFKALAVLGESWPGSQLGFLFKFWKNQFNQYRHRKWGVLFKYTSATKRDHVHRIVEIMAQLSNIYFYTGNGRGFVYSCLVGLNACEKLCYSGPNYALFLARNALLCWLNDDKKNSIFYIAKALHLMGNDKSDPGTLNICSLLCFAAGKFSNARDLLYQAIEGSRTLGVVTDCQAFYRSVGLLTTMRIFEGTTNESATDAALLKQMADTAHSNGDYEAEIWLGVYNIGNAIVVDRMADCTPYVSLLEAHVRDAADYNRIAIHGTLACYYARNQQFDMARRHIYKFVSVLPLLTVTPNIFPIFGLIFATMGLYIMVEDGKINLISHRDAKNYEKFIVGLSKLNHAFQQVKFWEFTQPCLYLARALPYIATRRIVEGYMVLHHGVFEMHFIQEIKFLKAFYWANLGKFAFTPEDRIEWTNRAKKDLDALSIPSDIYCNPDPKNVYYRGFQADLCSSHHIDTETRDRFVLTRPFVMGRSSTSSDITDKKCVGNDVV